MWQTLPHMGKESRFLPPEIVQIYPSPHRVRVMLSSSKCILPQFLPKMQRYYPHKSFATNSFLYLYFSFYFHLYLLFFFLNFHWIFFFFSFPPKLGILPQSRKIRPIPQCLRRVIEELTPLSPWYLWILPGISSCFAKRFASLFQNVFMCALTNHLHIINFTWIRASF